MNILCIGAGYVGGPTMAMISKHCPDCVVKVVDINQERINAWNSDNLPIFEPGLEEIVKSYRGKNLFFEVINPEHIKWAKVIFVSVNTPTKTYGEGNGKAADLQYWEKTARYISEHAESDKIIVEKSTLPVRTAEAMSRILNCNKDIHFEILSNPEFLAEGTAIQDLKNPDRILIGGDETASGKEAVNILVNMYAKWVPVSKILTSNVWSSELSKLVSNAFLAQRVSSINSISALTEVTGANIDEVSQAVGMDSRIGAKFLKASIGFGGSCFKKDILNLVYICRRYNLNEVADYWEQVVDINEYQKRRFVNNVIGKMFNTLAGKKIAVLGVAFKADTGDVRDTPAFSVCNYLRNEHAQIQVYDPKASENFKRELQINNVFDNCYSFFDNPYSATENADAIIVLTDWKEFKDIDFDKIYSGMRKPAFIFDGRNFLDHQRLHNIGFNVYSVGKQFLSNL